MCDPVSATLAAVSAGVSMYGASKQAEAQRNAANAVAQQNAADIAAQNAGFASRASATQAQTAAQTQANQDALTNQKAIADTMRAGQTAAMSNQQAVLGA